MALQYVLRTVRDSDQGTVSVTSSMDSRFKYTIYTDMKGHRQAVPTNELTNRTDR